MTSYMMNLIQSEQFHIITYLELDLSFIIHYLTYLTFSVNLCNQSFNQLLQSTFSINLHWIGGATGLWYVAFSDICI